MGKAKTNSKAAEKKRERLEMEKKMNARVAIVKAANNTDDPLENLPSFKVGNIAGYFVFILFPTMYFIELTEPFTLWC